MQVEYVNGERKLIESGLQTPIIGEYDVVIAGGGPAGIGAAMGAARAGVKTLVVERNNVLGGIATAGLMSMLWISGHKLVGIAYELFHKLKELEGGRMGHKVAFSPEMMKHVSMEMLLEANVNILFYTVVSAPIMDGNTVKGLIIENKSGRQAILAKTVIDCTGDADVAFRAGAPTVKGRDGDHKMRPMTILFRVGNIDIDRLEQFCFENPEKVFPDYYRGVADRADRMMRIGGFHDFVLDAREKGLIDGNINHITMESIDVRHGTATLNTTRVYDRDGSDAFDLTGAEIESRRQMMQVIDVMKKYIPGCENIYLLESASNLGVRQTRRIVGEYILTDQDSACGTKHEDSVIRFWSRETGIGLEFHTPDAGKEKLRDEAFLNSLKSYNPDVRPVQEEQAFYFPYRSLIPRDIDGLLAAGRCMSVSNYGETATRPIMICMACGQAAGAAGALCAKHNTGVRQVNMDGLRKTLHSQGVDTGFS